MIRDTEAHERALFTIESETQSSRPSTAGAAHRITTHGSNGNTDSFTQGHGIFRNPRQDSAVARILGGELGEQIRKENAKEGKERGEMDVNLLLRGAEKLCGI